MVYDGFKSPTGIEWGNSDKTYGQVKYGDDSQLAVLFYTKSVFDPAKSAEAGTRQYVNQIYVRIHTPGERLNIIDRPVQDSDKYRFQHQWNAFLQNRTQIPEGTPIDLLFPNNPAIADSLKACGIYTIQQCAKLSDNAIQTVGMGATDWKNKAIQYLENATSGTAFLQLRAESEKKDQEIKLLKRQFEQLKSQYDDIINRLKDPNTNSLQPSWIEGYDAQAERIEANHPSQSIRPTAKKGRRGPPKAEVEQMDIIKQVTEESIPQIDVTNME